MTVEEDVKDAVSSIAGVPRDDIVTQQYGDSLGITHVSVRKGMHRITGEIDQPAPDHSHAEYFDPVDEQISQYARFVDSVLTEHYRGTIMELIEDIATEHDLDVMLEEHDQLIDSTLYQVRAYDDDGNRHGFDYVPNPNQPLPTHTQKIDRMMLGLSDMVSP